MKKFTTWVRGAWKAVAGLVVPVVVVLGNAITTGSDGGTRITRDEWIAAALAGLATAATVYGVANKPASQPPDPSSNVVVLGPPPSAAAPSVPVVTQDGPPAPQPGNQDQGSGSQPPA